MYSGRSLTAVLKGQQDDDDGRPKCDVIEAFSRVTKEDDPRLSKKGLLNLFCASLPCTLIQVSQKKF